MTGRMFTRTMSVLGLLLVSIGISPRAFAQVTNAPDCNDPDAHDVTCTEPTKAIINAAQKAGYSYYIGHAEPSLLFFSTAGASGNNMQWKINLPKDPAASPTQSGSVVHNFELTATPWIGLALCDPNSNPFGSCVAASDANNPATAGAAFLELQFYPPGISGSSTQWSVRLHINTLQNNTAFQMMNCLEPTTQAFVTTNGLPGGPRLFMNDGDAIVITINDTANGLQTSVNDLTTAGTGNMVASSANGFVHNANLTDCTTTGFNFHPMYATASPGQVVPWAALGPNVSLDFEIGHWELCSDTACSSPPQEPNGPGGSLITDTACSIVAGVGGCMDSELDHDGTSYLADWPDGSANHPVSMVIGAPNNQGVGPLSAQTSTSTTYNQGYKTITFQTTEATNGAFYPFYSQIGSGTSCVFNFGNDNAGETNNFGKATQYGTTIPNSCFPAAVGAVAPVISKSFAPTAIALGANSVATFGITNPGTVTLTGVGFSDPLPGGLVVATPAGVSGSCGGGTITAVAGTTNVMLSGATLAPGASCTFTVNITGALPGAWTNTTGNVTSDETSNGNQASATLTVAAPPSISKSFAPPKRIAPGGIAALSFTITNPNSSVSIPGVGFVDNLPAGTPGGQLVVATPNGLTGSCGGGTITAIAGSSVISLAGATLLASQSCTFSVNITAPEGIYHNVTGAVFDAYGPGNTASDTLDVAAPPTLSKVFGAVSIGSLSTTTLTFTLTNPNHTLTLDGLQFSDTLPAGLVVSTPSVITGTCDGGTITAPAGSNLITLSSATLAPQASCTFSVKVSSNNTVLGSATNTTSTVTSNEALPGAPATATIFIGAPFLVSYAANLTQGESYINLSNAGANGAPLLGPGFGGTVGNICANVYAFDAGEELIACCSCLITPDATVNLGVNRDLTVKTLTGTVPGSLTVKVVSTLAGVNGSATTCTNTAATVATATLANGIEGWSTTLHATPGPTFDTTEFPFSAGTLGAGELASIGGRCASILGNGSGFGVCSSCRSGSLGGSISQQ